MKFETPIICDNNPKARHPLCKSLEATAEQSTEPAGKTLQRGRDPAMDPAE